MIEKFTIAGRWQVEKEPAVGKTIYIVIDRLVPINGTTDWRRQMLARPDYITPQTTPAEMRKKWDVWAEGTNLLRWQQQAQAAMLARQALVDRYKEMTGAAS